MTLEPSSVPVIEPVRLRGGGFAPRTYPLVGWMTFAVFVVIWQIVAVFQDDAILIPTPADVLAALVDMGQSGELGQHAKASLHRLFAGWSIGAGLGLAVGFAIGLYPVVRSAALPMVSALFAMPKIALLPVFIVWLGIGEGAKVATIAAGVFSPMAIAAYSGVDGVDRNLIRMAQSFDIPTAGIVRKILLPGALPALLTGVRVSASIAIVLLVGAEMIAAQYGIGALALNSGSLMRMDRVFAAVALLGAFGLTVSWTVGLAERILLRWR
jgi:NitT/TauT family transport system permease protein